MVTFSPAQVCVKVGTAGKSKCSLPAGNMFVRAFLAGAYIAMGAALATVGSTGVAEHLGAGGAQFILGALFPIGLILVVLTGAELFTGDAMFAPMAILQGHTGLKGLIYLWVVVYIGNLVGSLFLAYVMANGPFVSYATGIAAVTPFGHRAIGIATAKVSYAGIGGIWSVFLKGILCNWLVCLALFLGLAADEVISKIVGIWFPVMAFVATGFEHCVANMYFIPAGILTNMVAETVDTNILNWCTMWTNNIIWSTLGNIVGAVIFMAVIYYYCYKSEICALNGAK
ncbi:MAG TPA: formate/nitrite transporter family protein [Methanocorpusculum sp.]|nr:formate/nitrite transporter family protein [Methanocorpusculum sp.]